MDGWLTKDNKEPKKEWQNGSQTELFCVYVFVGWFERTNPLDQPTTINPTANLWINWFHLKSAADLLILSWPLCRPFSALRSQVRSQVSSILSSKISYAKKQLRFLIRDWF